ncbi:hypothetical protein [Brevibacterium sp. 'Marine']|uniref:hypothetical protein n=1 Tax=Brevibacterium sp. 'Marine' TaxID=2725563 RepID=UPI00145E7807|nr:hypothetical protein [Brevibacterium sp. 'Marine']
MTAQAHQPVDPNGQVDFEGLSPHEVQDAIRLYKQRKRLRVSGRATLRKHIDQDYVDNAQIVSGATQRQAVRSGEIRKRLLESEGAATYSAVADMRGSNEKAARQWVSRQRHEQRLFTVEAQGRVIVPAFQLGDDGDLDKAVSSIIVQPMLKAGVRAWAIWAWSTRPTGLLSGRVPAKLVHEKPEVVENAVKIHIDDLDFPAGA